MADWNERYSRGEHLTKEPMPLLVRAISGLKPGRALDLACGKGRHALFLAERGWQVTAIDASHVGIEMAKAEARVRGVEVDWRVADLERGRFEIEAEAYDLIGGFLLSSTRPLPAGSRWHSFGRHCHRSDSYG